MQYRYVCPNCGEHTLVDDDVRTLLVDEGCFLCNQKLSSDAFSAIS